MGEVLALARNEIAQEFERGFRGMTEVSTTIDELLDTPEQLFGEIIGKMPTNRKDVIISFKAGEPDWSKFDVPMGERRACCQVANAESGQAGSRPAGGSDGQSEEGAECRPGLFVTAPLRNSATGAE